MVSQNVLSLDMIGFQPLYEVFQNISSSIQYVSKCHHSFQRSEGSNSYGRLSTVFLDAEHQEDNSRIENCIPEYSIQKLIEVYFLWKLKTLPPKGYLFGLGKLKILSISRSSRRDRSLSRGKYKPKFRTCTQNFLILLIQTSQTASYSTDRTLTQPIGWLRLADWAETEPEFPCVTNVERLLCVFPHSQM